MSLMSDLRRLRKARLGRKSHRITDRQGSCEAEQNKVEGQSTLGAQTDEQQQPPPYHRRHRRRYESKKPDEVLADWTIAVAAFTGVLAVASVAGDVFSYRTLRAINGQLHEMQTGGAQTDKIIAADKDLAEAAKAQATAANNLADITRENIALSQRAWVGPSGATINAAPTIGNDSTFIVAYQNTGKEPARDAIISVNPFVASVDKNGNVNIPDMDDRIKNCKGTDPNNSGLVVFPSTGFNGNQVSTKLDKSQITNDVTNGDAIVGITGCVSYRSFDEPRHTAFCFFYKSGLTVVPNLNFCRTGGFAD